MRRRGYQYYNLVLNQRKDLCHNTTTHRIQLSECLRSDWTVRARHSSPKFSNMINSQSQTSIVFVDGKAIELCHFSGTLIKSTDVLFTPILIPPLAVASGYVEHLPRIDS